MIPREFLAGFIVSNVVSLALVLLAIHTAASSWVRSASTTLPSWPPSRWDRWQWECSSRLTGISCGWAWPEGSSFCWPSQLNELERALDDAIASGRWGPGIPLPEDLSAAFRWLLDHDPEMPPRMKGWRDEDLRWFLQVWAEDTEEEACDPWGATVALVKQQVVLWKGEGVGQR